MERTKGAVQKDKFGRAARLNQTEKSPCSFLEVTMMKVAMMKVARVARAKRTTVNKKEIVSLEI